MYDPGLVEDYVLDANQDPQEPVWAQDSTIAEMQVVDDPNDLYPGNGVEPNLRTASGELDFMQGLSDVVENFLSAQAPPVVKDKLDPIRTRELGADKWKARNTLVLPQMSGPILTQSSKRRRVTLINYGPNPAYISSLPSQLPAVPNTQPPNTVRLLVSGAAFYAPLVIETRDDVWAICLLTQSATVEIIEEFDMES